MNDQRVKRLLSLFAKGSHSGLSGMEVAASFLLDLVSETELDTDFISSVPSLPDEVRHEFLALLQRIEQDDFRWIPFLIGDPKPRDPAQYSAKLKRICSLLHVARQGIVMAKDSTVIAAPPLAGTHHSNL